MIGYARVRRAGATLVCLSFLAMLAGATWGLYVMLAGLVLLV